MPEAIYLIWFFCVDDFVKSFIMSLYFSFLVSLISFNELVIGIILDISLLPTLFILLLISDLVIFALTPIWI